MAGPAVSGEVAWSVPATVRQDRWLSETEPGLQTRLLESIPVGALFRFPAGICLPSGISCSGDLCLTISISPGFWLLLGAFLLLDRRGAAGPFLLAAGLHEAGHLLALRLTGIPVLALELRGSGAVIRAELPGDRREALALAAGPGANLLLAALFWRLWPMFGLCNLCLGLANLLPLPGRDGGRLLRLYKEKRKMEERLAKSPRT